jgi:cysteinyl-tRNA synthetase
LADEIRNKIQEKGYSIKDTKTETIIEKIWGEMYAKKR